MYQFRFRLKSRGTLTAMAVTLITLLHTRTAIPHFISTQTSLSWMRFLNSRNPCSNPNVDCMQRTPKSGNKEKCQKEERGKDQMGRQMGIILLQNFQLFTEDDKGSESRGHEETIGVQIYKREAEVRLGNSINTMCI